MKILCVYLLCTVVMNTTEKLQVCRLQKHSSWYLKAAHEGFAFCFQRESCGQIFGAPLEVLTCQHKPMRGGLCWDSWEMVCQWENNSTDR